MVGNFSRNHNANEKIQFLFEWRDTGSAGASQDYKSCTVDFHGKLGQSDSVRGKDNFRWW